MADDVKAGASPEKTTPETEKKVAGAGTSPVAKAEKAAATLPQAPADKSSPAVDVKAPASKAATGVGAPANITAKKAPIERDSEEHKKLAAERLEKIKKSHARKPEAAPKAPAPSPTRSRQKLTREILLRMTKPEILAVAGDRGYTAIGSGRESMVKRFLEEQAKDQNVEK